MAFRVGALARAAFLVQNAGGSRMRALAPSPLTSLLHALSCLSVLGALCGCDGCDKEPKVPFKLGSEAASDAELALVRELDAESQVFGSAVDKPRVDGAELPLDFVRALLAHDLDADGDRDVIALSHDTARRLRLSVSIRDGDAYQPESDVAGFVVPGDESCVLREAGLSALARDKAVLSIALNCGDPQRPLPPSLTLLSLEAPPRLYERFELLGDADTAALTLRAEASDTDADGHTDFLLEVTARDPARAAATLKLAWLDRAGGLSRDMREPEASFAAWASAAQSQLAKTPEQAAATAEQLLFFEQSLCRERAEAQLVVSGSSGISCGPSKAASQALATLVLARCKLQQVLPATWAYAELARRELKPDKRTLERVLGALAQLPHTPGITLREGPRLDPLERPRLALPSARFLTDDQLLLERPVPTLYDLSRSEELPAPAPGDRLFRDPSGQLMVADIERDACGGLRLRVERAPRAGAPYVPGAVVSTPALRPSAGRPPCKQAGAKAHADGGYQVLGWAPQGVVLVRGLEGSVVPLDLQGAPAGEPFALPAGAPLPAPLPSGAGTPDGARYAELSPAGILVYARGGSPPELWRPDGYSALAASARQPAISPSGKRVAVLANGGVYVLSR
jgi:hypothetical protein